jgi:hypothetical protein
MIQRNHMISAYRLSDVRHSHLLGSLSFLPARCQLLAAIIMSMSLGTQRFPFTVSVSDTAQTYPAQRTFISA